VRTLVAEARDAGSLASAKAGRTISMCLPCRNESSTIGPIVRAARRELIERHPLLDELIVIDDRSTDDTATVAADEGATVVSIESVHAIHGSGRGKGNALWASLLVSDGDVVVWCDGDVISFSPTWVTKLAAPLMDYNGLALVKASYRRPTESGGGGRTTELVARPLLSLLAPELAALAQPLAGEFAGRRTMLEQLSFCQGWGVEIGLLLDVVDRFGVDAVAQVDLGERRHRHRTLEALSIQAAEVMATALRRLTRGAVEPGRRLLRADGTAIALNLDERPAIDAIRARLGGGSCGLTTSL
jgi:glucosyl-3-phosphoglycerate synthase